MNTIAQFELIVLLKCASTVMQLALNLTCTFQFYCTPCTVQLIICHLLLISQYDTTILDMMWITAKKLCMLTSQLNYHHQALSNAQSDSNRQYHTQDLERKVMVSKRFLTWNKVLILKLVVTVVALILLLASGSWHFGLGLGSSRSI